MTQGKHKHIGGILLAMAIVTTSGCGVLTVDVDVYKGPLSFSPSTQVERVATLAASAKPLLVRLRNELERDEDAYSWLPCARPYDSACAFHGYVPPQVYQFKSAKARCVNELLAEYNPPPTEDIKTLFEVTFEDDMPSVESIAALFDVKSNTPLTAASDAAWAKVSDLKKNKTYVPGYRKIARILDAWHERSTKSLAGRPGKGVEDMLKAYKTAAAAESGPDRSEALETAERELFASLVHFAQRALFLANNEMLVERREQPGAINVTVGGLLKWVVGGRDDLPTKAYQDILQTVGNSILAQVDAIRRRNEHDARQLSEKNKELQALVTTWRLPPAQHVEQLVAAVNKEIKDLRAEDANDAVAATLEKASTEIKAAKDEAVKLLDDKGPVTLQADVFAALNKVLAAVPSASTRSTDAKLALGVVRKPKYAGLALQSFLANGDLKSARDVVDAQIKHLRHKIVENTVDGGGDERSNQLKDALSQTLQWRRDMVFHYSASDYLRTSFPATSYQRGSDQLWRNMLGDQALRQIPFSGYWGPGGQWWPSSKIQKRQDKHYWQNVNRVRVSGAGVTNYVIAKDDIGNWYVKQYEADPGPIIEGMASLAGLAVSSMMAPFIKTGAKGVSALAATSKQSANAAVALANTAAAEKTLADKTATLLYTMESEAKSLPDSLTSKCIASTDRTGDTFKKQAKEFYTQGASEMASSIRTAKTRDADQRVIGVLKAMKVYYDGLRDQAQAGKAKAVKAEADKAKADKAKADKAEADKPEADEAKPAAPDPTETATTWDDLGKAAAKDMSTRLNGYVTKRKEMLVEYETALKEAGAGMVVK